jgi:catechol 2,3-dioxygenase-like lactoylglutathione lyase family enzyme
MLESSHIVAFAAATDLDRARAFYEQVLGLTVVERGDFACVFDVNATMLRVTAVSDVASGPLPAGTRWPGSPTPTATSCRSPSSLSRYDW